MDVGHFTGQVHPQSRLVTLSSANRVHLEASQWGPEAIITIAVVNGVLDIECVVSVYSRAILGFLHSRAFDLAHACIDVVAFGTGYGLMVSLDTFTEPDGTVIQMSFANPYLAKECTLFTLDPANPETNPNFDLAVKLVMREPHLFLVLNDLIQTLYLQHQTLTACGRVLDGLRRIASPNLNKKQGWPVLHGIVNAEAAYMQWISDQSTDPRHGDKNPKGVVINKEALRRTWAVMNRFLEYRKRGNQPLPITEFPLLSSDPPS